VFWEVSAMPKWLQPVAYLMPLTHANTALREIMLKGTPLVDVGGSLLALVAIAIAVVALASRTAGRVRV
jgi:ABC-2 type transport system permease protein